jgi:predicted TPR repeat methyltransferase
VGIGSGLSSQNFAQAGLNVYGMDFSPVMLKICKEKKVAYDLKQHDLQSIPWPYAASFFDQLICCGVYHFIVELEPIFVESNRVLRNGGTFAFTTRSSPNIQLKQQKNEQHRIGNFDVFSHAPEYVHNLLEGNSFRRIKTQKCFVGDDIFLIWVCQKI